MDLITKEGTLRLMVLAGLIGLEVQSLLAVDISGRKYMPSQPSMDVLSLVVMIRYARKLFESLWQQN